MDVIHLQDPVGRVETQRGHQGHHQQAHHQARLLQGPRHGEEGCAHHRVPDSETKHIVTV